MTLPVWARPEILTQPNIPKPLHGVNPRTVMGSSWWNKVRQEAYARYDFHCHACGVHKSSIGGKRKSLECHEEYSIDYARGRAVFTGTVALCPDCHRFIHSGRLFALWDKGQIGSEYANRILIRGLRILDQANRERGLQLQPFAHTLIFMYMLTGPRSYQEARDIVTAKGYETSEPEFAPWGEWVLEIDGKEYPPIFASYEEWLTEYGYTVEEVDVSKVEEINFTRP